MLETDFNSHGNGGRWLENCGGNGIPPSGGVGVRKLDGTEMTLIMETVRTPLERYSELMFLVRHRLDMLQQLSDMDGDERMKGETIALQGRKVVESIAYACLIATDNAGIHLPQKVMKEWHAPTIFKALVKQTPYAFPSPSMVRSPNAEEAINNPGIKAVFEGIPNRRLTEVVGLDWTAFGQV